MFVCKSWLHATKGPELYTVFDLESYFIEESDRFQISEPKRWWIRSSESKSWWTHEFEIKIDNMIRDVVELSNGGLKEIRVRHCSDHSLSLIAQRCPNLEVLSIKSSPNVTDEFMAKVASGCPKLKEVDISYCYGISQTSLVTLGRNCSNILILKRNHIGIYKNRFESAIMIENIPTNYLRTRPEDGDLVAATIGKFMPQLLHLELRFSELSFENVDLICKGCKNLENLDISSWKYLGWELLEKATCHLRNLKKFKSRRYP
ncbi:F-box protein SKIP1 [Tanacetum coccineum]